MPAAATHHPEVLALLRRHGWNTTSFQVLEPHFRYWMEPDACVAYVETPRAWVAAGAPLAAEAELSTVAERFARAAQEAGKSACFFGTEQRFVDTAAALRSFQVGEQPVWEPERWPQTLTEVKSLREQIRRARAKGVTVRALDEEALRASSAPWRAQLEDVIVRWQRAHPMPPMGFLVALQPLSQPGERRCFLAEREGQVVGFLSSAPIYLRQGALFENLIRDPRAPNGTAELLFDAGVRDAAERGVRRVTLGLAPLSGAVGPWLQRARELGKPLFDFDGLRSFKAKLRPHAWEPVFVSHPPQTSPLTAQVEVLRAFARGGFLRFGLQLLLRGPVVVLQWLALLLIPWTLLLAAADTETFFPSRSVQLAWVAFDAGVAAALLVLTRRWSQRLAAVLAGLVTVDAVLTVVQAVTYNLRRPVGLLEGVAIAAGLAAPCFAAFLLWRGFLHRRRLRSANG